MPAPDDAPAYRTFRQSMLGGPDWWGCALALVFWWQSLLPTLLPRSGLIQGVVSAVCTAIGYALGVLFGQVVRAVLRKVGAADLGARWGRWARWGLGALAVVLVPVGLGFALVWQNQQRQLVAMEPLTIAALPVTVAVTLLVGSLLVVIGRLVSFVVRGIDHRMLRVAPRWVSIGVTTLLVAFGSWVVITQVGAPRLLDYLNSSFGATNAGTAAGVVQPTSPLQSGGPGSLTPWDTLGAEGRAFAAGATPVADLQTFAGPSTTAKAPIRVYAGLTSAPTPADRADLAVRELERTGAFDRSVLAVVTVTGTGWVDPVAAASIEYLRAGDTAIVAQQYSYLPSWISFLVDTDKAADTGIALFDAVHARWAQLPADRRPKLVAFGLSLGSFGSEAVFDRGSAAASIGAATSSADAVLWVGPTDGNPVWRQLRDARDPGSPVWAPVYGDGTTARLVNQGADLPVDPPPVPPRVLWVQHPSDPVGWWNWSTMVAPPAWMARPTGYDVPESPRWFPIVTWVQEVADLMNGFSATPGHGHNYDPDMAAGWAAVAAPPGWTTADTARLTETTQKLAS